MTFSIKDFFSKCDQIRKKLRIWTHLQKKSLMEIFIFLFNVKVIREGRKLTTSVFRIPTTNLFLSLELF